MFTYGQAQMKVSHILKTSTTVNDEKLRAHANKMNFTRSRKQDEFYALTLENSTIIERSRLPPLTLSTLTLSTIVSAVNDSVCSDMSDVYRVLDGICLCNYSFCNDCVFENLVIFPS